MEQPIVLRFPPVFISRTKRVLGKFGQGQGKLFSDLPKGDFPSPKREEVKRWQNRTWSWIGKKFAQEILLTFIPKYILYCALNVSRKNKYRTQQSRTEQKKMSKN